MHHLDRRLQNIHKHGRLGNRILREQLAIVNENNETSLYVVSANVFLIFFYFVILVIFLVTFLVVFFVVFLASSPVDFRSLCPSLGPLNSRNNCSTSHCGG